MHLGEIQKKFSEFNLFYRYLTQKHEIPVNKRKTIIIIIWQK